MQRSSCLQLLYISDLTISLSLSLPLTLSLASPSTPQITRDTWPFVIPARAFWPRIDDAHRILPLCHVKWIRRILLLPHCPFLSLSVAELSSIPHSYFCSLWFVLHNFWIRKRDRNRMEEIVSKLLILRV